MSLNDRLDKMMQRHATIAIRHHGERGTYLAKNSTTPIPLICSWNELTQIQAEVGEYGHRSNRREAQFALPVTSVPTPGIDESLTFTAAAAPQIAGTWTIIAIDNLDPALTTVRARLDKPDRSNAPGSRVAP